MIGIALGVASFTGVLSISRSIMYAFEQTVLRTAGKAQLQISNGTAGVSTELIDQINALPEVEVASGTVQYDVQIPSLGRRLTIFGILFGADHTYREAQFGTGAVRLPDAGTFVVKTDSVAPAESLLAEQSWTLGSTLEVLGPKGARTLTVRGSLDARGTLSVFGGDVAVMDSDAAQHAFGALDNFHWVDVVVASDADIEAARSTVAAVVAGRGIVETPFGRSKRMESMLATLRWMLTACGTVAMLVGIFLIQHTIATAIRQRQDDFAKLRAVGATRVLLVLAVLGEVGVVGLVGSLLGVAAGLGFAAVAARAFGDAIATMYVSIPPPPVTLQRGEFAAAMALGGGAVLLAAVPPCMALLRLRSLRELSQVPSENSASYLWRLLLGGVALICAGVVSAHQVPSFGFAGGVGAVATFAGCLFLGVTLLVPAYLATLTPGLRVLLRMSWGRLGTWVWQQVRRYQFHTATTMGALAAAVAFTIGLTTLLGSYRAAVAEWISQTLTADVFVNAGSTVSLLSGPVVDPTLQEEIAGLESVARVMPWRFVQVDYHGHPIIVQAAGREMINRWHADVDVGRGDDGVVISDTLAERYGLDVGDRFTVPAPISPLNVTVIAVRPDYLLDLGNLKVDWSTFVRHFGEQGANILFVDTVDPSISGGLKRQVEAIALGRYDVTVLTGGELRGMLEALIDQSFALTTALQALAILVTVLAMINATSAAIIDRGAELATWRALGLERARLLRLLTWEAALVGALAGVLGVAAGALVGGTLVRVVAPAVAGFRMAVDWPVGWMLGIIALTSAFAGGAAAIAARTQMPRPIVLARLRP